ncbi:hypothetical protein [Nocardia sp. NBC_01388]|uniref:hypothetical protein n=1 Tax=Nocardia sp. NBC_01388 TaxID=2903596 RepID=UPI0032461B71
MKPYEEYEKTATDGRAFSCGTDWEVWQYAVCLGNGRMDRRCVNDDGIDDGNGCPLILLSLNDKTPVEWLGSRGKSKGEVVMSCRAKTTPADVRRSEREAETAAAREALDSAHYPMFDGPESDSGATPPASASIAEGP